MARRSLSGAVGVGLVSMGILTLAGRRAAVADTPTGTCTSSYEAYTFGVLSGMDHSLTLKLVQTIDSNHNGLICFKPYPNGAHNGHLGNLVDDKAARHS